MMDNKNKLLQGFVLQGYLSPRGGWSSKLSPVKNAVFSVGDFSQAFSAEKPFLAQTDAKGLLYAMMDNQSAAVGIEKKLGPAPVPYHFVGEPEIFEDGQVFNRLPIGAISYLANGPELNWQKTLHGKLKSYADSNSWTNYRGKLEAVPFGQLRSPKKNDKSDDVYREWYQQAQAAGLESVHAFVLPTVRALVLCTTLDPDDISEITVNIPDVTIDKPLVTTGEVGGISCYAMQGGEDFLPADKMYEITVRMEDGVLDDKKWSKAPLENSSYSIKEMARFDIHNELGEFSVIIIDPISVEESLITQHPKELGHLLKVANDQQKNNTFGPVQGLSKGLGDYVLRLSALKKSAEFVNSFSTFTLSNGDLIDQGASFSKAIFKALDFGNDHPAYKFIDTIESGKNATVAWKAVGEAIDELTGPTNNTKTFSKKLLDKYLITPDFDTDTEKDFKNTIAGRLSDYFSKGKSATVQKERLISTFEKVDKLGKGIAIVNTVAAGVQTYGQAKKAFTKTYPEADSAKYDVKTATSSYVTLTQTEMEVPSQIVFGIDFESSSSTIKPEYYRRCNDLAVQIKHYITEYEKLAEVHQLGLSFSIQGHTCDIGTTEDNQTLSKDRADSVVRYLTTDATPKIGSEFLSAVGHGESLPEVPNNSKSNRRANRRVILNHSSLDVVRPAPSREGINTLELLRATSVLKEMDADKETIELVQRSANAAMGALLFTPVGPAVAIALAFWEAGKASLAAAKSLADLVDEVARDGMLAQSEKEKSQLLHLLKNSAANVELLEEYVDLLGTEDSALKEVLEQFRIRAEALNGLVYLLILAAISSEVDDEAGFKHQCEERYRIPEYIQNFIINDGWVFHAKNTFVQDLQLDSLMWQSAHSSFAEAKCDLDVYFCSGGGRGHASRRYRRAIPNFNLGLYWSHVTSQKQASAKKYWGLDEKYRFLDTSSEYNEPVNGTQLPVKTDATQTNALKANFQKMFPVHTFGTDNFFEFAKNFRTTWEGLRKEDYAFIGVFKMEVQKTVIPAQPMVYRDTSGDTETSSGLKDFSDIGDFLSNAEEPQDDIIEISDVRWVKVDSKPFDKVGNGRNSRKRWQEENVIKHDTPIAIVVIFKKDIKYYMPVKATLKREDVSIFEWFSLKGPDYEEVSRPLNKKDFEGFPELENKSELWEGRFGCVIKPFYQHGMKRIDGLKPMATNSGMEVYLSDDKRAHGYYAAGHLSNMHYEVDIMCGNADKTKMTAPIWGEFSDDESYKEPRPQTIYMSVDCGQNVEKSSLLNKEFLLSASEQESSRTLFEGDIQTHGFVRFGISGAKNKYTPFMTKGSSRAIVKASNKLLNGAPVIDAPNPTDKSDYLRAKAFNWESRIDFGVALSCDALDTKSYEAIGLNWKSRTASIELVNNDKIGFDEHGPQLKGEAIYIGKVVFDGRQTSIEINKNLNESETDLLYGLIKKENGEHIFVDKFIIDSIAGINLYNRKKQERHIYFAKFSCSYENPKGKRVNSLRPFGEKPLIGDFEFYLKNFSCAGLKGVKGVRDGTFGFNEPNDYENGPWAKRDAEADLSRYPKGSKEYKFLSADGMDGDLVEFWMEEQANKTEFSDIIKRAIK